MNKLCHVLQVSCPSTDRSKLHINHRQLTLAAGDSPCIGGRSTLRWGSRGAVGWGSGCGRTRGTSRSRGALLRLCTRGRIPCGGRPPPSPGRRRCPPRLLSPPPWPPTGCPPSPGIRGVGKENIQVFHTSHPTIYSKKTGEFNYKSTRLTNSMTFHTTSQPQKHNFYMYST